MATNLKRVGLVLSILFILTSTAQTVHGDIDHKFRIDKNTEIIDYQYKEHEEVFQVTIRSSYRQQIAAHELPHTLNDGINRIEKKTRTLKPGINKYSFQVSDGRKVGLTISTNLGTVSIVKAQEPEVIEEPATWRDVQTSAIAGLITGLTMPFVLALAKKHEKPIKPKRWI
ncbi:MAG: Spindle-shaped haloviruses associated protein [Candidatus Methanohalarchaeum thermophilum]|uniref:Spindle-shaped haloviruses associated protein n=1 Tax=Methanohalarchaeum thermophilum TaxID=1903181 RepID=A0A1Q6DSW8_METT1|nr:MAG: Spindle-shaped haloviruses associated protein [Candidatus Methanohalarchaeum thermophilum]